MTITLRLGQASATLLPHRGGLLSALTLEARGQATPLLWMPPEFSEQESGWPGGGLPVLFPFAGRVFHAGQPFQYALGDELYRMPLHGFAFGLPWEVVQAAPAKAVLELRSRPQTADLYPFSFTLTATYELTSTGLSVSLHAKNDGGPGSPPMPVALGVHPYFRAPLGGSCDLDAKAACRLETAATAKYAVTPLGGAGKSTPVTDDERSGPLADKLYANLILAGHSRPEAALVDPAAQLAVRVRWDEPYSYLVLWTKDELPFHCVEPWMGLPDAVSNNQGSVWLKGGEAVTCRLTVSLDALAT